MRTRQVLGCKALLVLLALTLVVAGCSRMNLAYRNLHLLIPRSTFLYYRKEQRLRDLYISTTPLYQFARHVLINGALDEAVVRYLEEFLHVLPDNPEWQILLFQYGLKPIANER